ncbi:hypothetical protein RFI_33138 [Reticulomyxa filosa]|uniref:Uncharacterized protein n=1 Tax=Reticulomyxa filosa TaxID=46433 RepID=X6LRJ9_RETFI|nr:hypothetical protein RFI_33138 [Reticulomyxa filosa]|eukprot:ETO04259.1 hypothetical protein RFI_33138 [Reticulomyxa filosa]
MQKLNHIFNISGKHAIQQKGGASTAQTTIIVNEGTHSGFFYTFLAFSATMIGYNDVQDKQVVDVLDLRKVALIVNYANTCFRQTNNYFEPQNLEELKAIIQQYHDNKLKIRLVGSRLSPNVIGCLTKVSIFLKKKGKKKERHYWKTKKYSNFLNLVRKKFKMTYTFFFVVPFSKQKKEDDKFT